MPLQLHAASSVCRCWRDGCTRATFALCIGSLRQRLHDFDWERKPGGGGSAGFAIMPQGKPLHDDGVASVAR